MFNESVSKVKVVEDVTVRGEKRYAVDYCIGTDKVPNNKLALYNKACDTIIFREYNISGLLNCGTIAISSGRLHKFYFDGCSYKVARSAACKIAKILGLDLNSSVINFTPTV